MVQGRFPYLPPGVDGFAEYHRSPLVTPERAWNCYDFPTWRLIVDALLGYAILFT
jgi:hypothetical protein